MELMHYWEIIIGPGIIPDPCTSFLLIMQMCPEFLFKLAFTYKTLYSLYYVQTQTSVFFWLFCVSQQNCTVEMKWAGASAHPGMEKIVYDVEQFSIFWRRYKRCFLESISQSQYLGVPSYGLWK